LIRGAGVRLVWIIEDASTKPIGLRQVDIAVFLYGAGTPTAAEALEVLDVRQDVFAADPLAQAPARRPGR
jgi:hypothetical protein